MKIQFRSAAAAVSLFAFAASTGCSAPLEEEDTVETTDDALRALDTEEKVFLDAINAYRTQNGLGTLTATPLLNQVSYDHSLSMGQNKFFSHNSLDGTNPFDRMSRAGYKWGSAAENIAAGNSGGQATFEQWRNSPGHNANMLGKGFKAIGIGRAVVAGSPYTYYWTTDFGDYVDSSVSGTPTTPTNPTTPTTPTQPPATGDKVTVFEHANFGGVSQALGVGRYTLSSLGVIGNDQVSSLRVPASLKVTLYQHNGFQGRTKAFSADAAYVGSDFNDQASSIVVEAK